MIPSMRSLLFGIGLALASACVQGADWKSLFDGRSFAGWDGDTNRMWRIEDGALVGGSLTSMVPRNEFLASERSFTNFVLQLRFKLEGSEGFVNSGVQIRSQRVPNDSEMIGYQADIGEGWYGCIYDESRRNTVLARPEAGRAEAGVLKEGWNTYWIRCEGPRVRLTINDIPMVDYTEADPAVPQWGRVGLQIHGGGKAVVRFKDIRILELP